MTPAMHSWLFRHRARLRVLYGLAPADPVEAPAEARVSEPAPAPEGTRRLRTRRNRLVPGTLARRGRWVLVSPMPRRVD